MHRAGFLTAHQTRAPNLSKALATGCAEAALVGIVATPSRDDHGRPTLVLTRGVWTREVQLHELAEALAQAASLQEVAPC